MTPAFEHLLHEIYTLHTTVSEVGEFAPYPTDLRPLDMRARHLPCADHFLAEPAFKSAQHPLAQAIYNAGADAYWRDTYAGSKACADFMQRFGCFCVIGQGGAWLSHTMSAYIVVMPAGLHYPWHHHPAEELYYVLAGSGVFMRAGESNEVLQAGGSAFHASNQPHALETLTEPVMAYVVWRNHLGIKPVLTERPVTADHQTYSF